MVDMITYWPTVLILGLGTFIIRLSFILIMDRITMPETVQQMLRFIPAAVLTALTVPAVLLHKSGSTTMADPERIVAALIAVVVAWKTKNILATIGTGMAVLWGLQALM